MSDKLPTGEACKNVSRDREKRSSFKNARKNQAALAALEAEEAVRDKALQPRLRAETRERHPEWFA